MTDRADAYRDMLLDVLHGIEVHHRMNEYLIHDIIEALDENGDGHLVPAELVEQCNHMDQELAERVIAKSRTYDEAVEAAKTPEEREAEAIEDAKELRIEIYSSLTDRMRELLMFRLAGYKTPNGYGQIAAGLRTRELLDENGKLNDLGVQIAQGVAKRSVKKFTAIEGGAYIPDILPPHIGKSVLVKETV